MSLWSGWNKADKTLLLATVLFVFGLCLHLSYPSNVFATGFLFVAEAALVGGIADWFAVTALFRKPLGFPYHTAILPRRREAFVNASVVMVQKEFFSRRKIFLHLGRLHLMPMLMEWLDKPETRDMLLGRLMKYTKEILQGQDFSLQAGIIAKQLKEVLRQTPELKLLDECGGWLRSSGKDREILAKIAGAAYSYAERRETKDELERMLEEYAKERAKNPAEILMAGFAQMLNLVNFEEAAGLMQKQILSMIDELRTPGSELQSEVLSIFAEKAAELREDPDFKQMVRELRDELVDELPLDEAILRTWHQMREDFIKSEYEAGLEAKLPAVHSWLRRVFVSEYARGVKLLKTDEVLRKNVEKFLYDLIARSALHAQTLVGVIVTNVLNRLTDEQMNHMIYDKVEPDLLWIRMNGSIVGAAIGIMIFLLFQITS